MIKEEKSDATISKYIRDIKKLMDYARGKEITKEIMAMYKKDLYINQKYELSSINSFITAVNGLFVTPDFSARFFISFHILLRSTAFPLDVLKLVNKTADKIFRFNMYIE